MGLISIPLSRSLSPCLKNSSMILSVHCRYTCRGFVGLLKSAQCTMFLNTCIEVKYHILLYFIGRRWGLNKSHALDSSQTIATINKCIGLIWYQSFCYLFISFIIHYYYYSLFIISLLGYYFNYLFSIILNNSHSLKV